MNEAFDQYRELYYEGGISSVYLWDTSHAKNFAGVILFKKKWDTLIKKMFKGEKIFFRFSI